MKRAHVLSLAAAKKVQLGLLALLFLQGAAAVAGAASDPMNALRRVYGSTLLFKTFHSVCDQIAPQNAGAHRAVYETFAKRHSLARIERFFSATPNPVPRLANVKAGIDRAASAVRKRLSAQPGTCSVLGDLLETMVTKQVGPSGITNLGAYFDGLLARAKLAPAPQPVAPAKTQKSGPTTAPAAVEKGAPTEPIPSAQKVAVASTNEGLPMPTLVRDRVRELPGLSWTLPPNVRSQGVHCVWRCSGFGVKGGGSSGPRLIVHEAVPLSAEPAIAAVLAGAKGNLEITREHLIPADRFGEGMAMKPDRVVVKNIFFTHHGKRSRQKGRRVLFALEKDGLSVVAEWSYSGVPSPQKTRKNELLLGSLIRSIRLNKAVVTESLRSPLPIKLDMVDGAPPAADQVIYAETPKYHHNTLTLSGYYDDDVRYLDKAAADQEGGAMKLNKTTYYYVPPQKDGVTIEGAFRSSSGYVGPGISVLKTKSLVFHRNGRYSTRSGSGVVGGLASTGSSSASEGRYRIFDYTLELKPDNGPVRRVAFFPYYKNVFWPGSKASDGDFGLLNVGGKVMYRDDD